MAAASSLGAPPNKAVGAAAGEGGELNGTLHKLWGQVDFEECSSDEFEARTEALTQQMKSIVLLESSSLSRSSAVKGGEPGQAAHAVEGGFVPQNIGSAAHLSGNCKPCFVYKGGDSCRYGAACTYCHHHVEQRFGRPGKKKRRRVKILEQARAAQEAAGGGAEGSEGETEPEAEAENRPAKADRTPGSNKVSL
mmetsp:Transcript_57080/g.177147  ORF Transcript_57080/g.177147 Transcript_57080/m.177147 type:complete len:194 (-) Transcript_57080:187-768(-)